tara:strand:- start:210 stop:335 length:126 start_codon:yes stop_codon:yes gene_type:complete
MTTIPFKMLSFHKNERKRECSAQVLEALQKCPAARRECCNH